MLSPSDRWGDPRTHRIFWQFESFLGIYIFSLAAASPLVVDHSQLGTGPIQVLIATGPMTLPECESAGLSQIYLLIKARRVARRVFSRDSRGNCRRMGAIKVESSMGMPRESEMASHSM